MELRNKTIRWSIILSTLIIAVIIIVQLNWLQKTYKYERKQFNAKVSKTIKRLFTDFDLSNDSTFTFAKNIELALPELYILRIDKNYPIDSIKNYLSVELTDFDVLTDCQISYYNSAEDKYTESRYIDVADSYDQTSNKFETPVFERKYDYLSIYFPHRSRYIIMQMLFWIVSSITLLIVLIGFGFSIFFLYQQQFLNETQKDFVNNFTHEFKTPLSVIKIAADVLNQPAILDKPDKHKNYTEIIIRQTTHIQNQLNRMLVLAYTEHRTLPLQKELLNMQMLCREAVTNIQPLLEKKSGSVIFDFNDNNELFKIDRSYMLLAFINVLENAVKYADKPEITIRSYIKGSDLYIEFIDNGMGINKKQQKKIFNKFFRVSYGDIHHAKGFGLGLNFVKKIMDAHKGSISVKSEINKGSTFTIKIPKR